MNRCFYISLILFFVLFLGRVCQNLPRSFSKLFLFFPFGFMQVLFSGVCFTSCMSRRVCRHVGMTCDVIDHVDGSGVNSGCCHVLDGHGSLGPIGDKKTTLWSVLDMLALVLRHTSRSGYEAVLGPLTWPPSEVIHNCIPAVGL